MYNPIDISRIDRQIEDLQRLKASYQNMSQPPINNIIATQPVQQPITPQPIQDTRPKFEARFTTENPSDVYVQNKTAFINLKNNILTIKETDGDTKEYTIVPPKDEKDIRIQQLENEINVIKENYMKLQSNTINNLSNVQSNLQSNQIQHSDPIIQQPIQSNFQPETIPQDNMPKPIIYNNENNYTISEQPTLTDKIKSKFKKQ